MSIAVNYWRHGSVRESTLEWISKAFTGMAYYRMDPNEGRVMGRLNETVRQLQTGEILEGPEAEPFQRIYFVLKTLGQVRSEERSA